VRIDSSNWPFCWRSLRCRPRRKVSLRGTARATGVEVKATPLTRPAVLAFYQARGFSAEAIAPYADACVFSFEVANNTKKPLRLRLADWRTGGAAGSHLASGCRNPGRTSGRGAASPGRRASPSAGRSSRPTLEFAPGDWIMGMAALARRPDGAFRLTIPYTHRQAKT
jgi:hypothetical protein